MAGRNKKVFVALSGGVDSSTSTALLIRQGYDCSGVFMITNDQALAAQAEAEKMAEKLGIELHILDFRPDFEQVLEYFGSEYRKGKTPNPCVFCNRKIKFGKLWDFAKSKGADLFATGHYARILQVDNHAALYQAANLAKDQSYALAMVKRNAFENVIFPLGEYTKEQTRQLAAEFNLGIEKKSESQEICFIPDDDYIAVIEQRCPELARTGKIIDSDGNILGEHNGIHRFTIGQRRGLRVAMGKPYYVTKIDAQTNTVTLGPKEEVMRDHLSASHINWLTDEIKTPFKARVKIRYNGPGQLALVVPNEDGVRIEFDQPVSAITPGQLAVFYVKDDQGDRVVGAGWIERNQRTAT